jgi:hypothetical protein
VIRGAAKKLGMDVTPTKPKTLSLAFIYTLFDEAAKAESANTPNPDEIEAE